MTKEEFPKTLIFPIGEPNDAYAQYFVGQSYLAPLSTAQVPIFNVTFEPGCRNNWHIHHAKSGGGQMLVCVGGRGWYQVGSGTAKRGQKQSSGLFLASLRAAVLRRWGKDAVELTPGKVINIPANVKHWHGAAADSWLSHLAIEVAGEETSNEWLEAVSDEEYSKLK